MADLCAIIPSIFGGLYFAKYGLAAIFYKRFMPYMAKNPKNMHFRNKVYFFQKKNIKMMKKKLINSMLMKYRYETVISKLKQILADLMEIYIKTM